MVLGRMYGSACTLISLWWIARELSLEDFGRYSFYLALFVVLDTWSDFGTGQIAVQRTASDPSALAAVLASARRLRLWMGFAGSLLITSLALAFEERGAVWIWLASLYPLTHALELSTVPLRNRMDWRIPVTLRAIASTLSLVFVLLLGASEEREPARYLCAVAAGSTLGNLLLYWACRAHQPAPTDERYPLRLLWASVWPLGLASLCQQAYFYADSLFVRSFAGPEELGPYHIGVRVMSYAIMVAIYATQAALPWLARAHAAGDLGSACAGFAATLFARACALLGFAMPWTAAILDAFHPGFSRASISLQWLIAASAAVYAGSALMTALVAAGASRSILRVALLALAVNLLGNAWAVPHYGVSGAGAMTLITELCVVLLASIELRRLGARGLWRAQLGTWCAAPALFLATWALSAALQSVLLNV